MKRILSSAVAVSLLVVANGAFAKDGKGKDHSCKNDPIVGVWTYNAQLPPSPDFPQGIVYWGDWTYYADGTYQGASTTTAGQQPFQDAPAGGYGGLDMGKWKRIGKRRYKSVHTNIGSFKDLSNPFLPGIPALRLFAELEVELSKDGKTMTLIEGQFTYYALEEPGNPPFQIAIGGPFPIINGKSTRFCPFNANGQ